MAEETTAPLINIGAIHSLLSTIQSDGKNVVMSEEASKRIADFKRAQKLLSEAEDILKEQVRLALLPFKASSLRGRYATISISKPRAPASKYKIDNKAPDADDYKKDKITRVPDDDHIDAYFSEFGELPEGVTMSEASEGAVSIRLKEVNGDSD